MDKNGEPILQTENVLVHVDNFETNWTLEFDDAVEIPHLPACALLKRKLALQVKFDEMYKGSGMREETDFFVRLNKLGAKILFQSKACQINLPRCEASGGFTEKSAPLVQVLVN